MTWANCRMRRVVAGSSDPVVERATLRVRHLERSILFYRHVFGFRIVADARHDREASVIMAAPGQACLTLREEKRLQNASAIDAVGRGMRPVRLLVHDVTEARASLWDLGVPLAPGTREPGEDPRAMRSLFVDDPDGHRIELAELTSSERFGSL